jgi:hypothetical protein
MEVEKELRLLKIEGRKRKEKMNRELIWCKKKVYSMKAHHQLLEEDRLI